MTEASSLTTAETCIQANKETTISTPYGIHLPEVWERFVNHIYSIPNPLTLFRMGFFGAAHGWRGAFFPFNNLGLALVTNLKFCTSVVKGLKLKVKKFWRPNPTFVEVTGEKLLGGFLAHPQS